MAITYANETSSPAAAYPVLRALKGERTVLELPDGKSPGSSACQYRLMRTWLRDRLGLYSK